MNNQKGFTLTEIMISVGVVAALMINGYNFYSNAIAKAQANEAHTAAKKIIDGVLDYHMRFETLPITEGEGDHTANLEGLYSPKGGVSNGHVKEARWNKSSGSQAGWVSVTFKDSEVQRQIKDKEVRFYLKQTLNESHVDYLGCRTNIVGGDFDGDAYDDNTILYARSPILPECLIGLADDPATDFGMDVTSVLE